MSYELNKFKQHEIWTLVSRPEKKTIIGTRWVFHKKMDEDRVVTRNKAHLVALGFTQLEGLDYDETFSPMARLKAICFFLTYASYMNFTVYQMEVMTTFMHEDLHEEVYPKKPLVSKVKIFLIICIH